MSSSPSTVTKRVVPLIRDEFPTEKHTRIHAQNTVEFSKEGTPDGITEQ